MKKAVQILSVALLVLCFYVFAIVSNTSFSAFFLPNAKYLNVDGYTKTLFLSVAVLLCGGATFFAFRKKSKVFCLIALIVCFLVCGGVLFIYGHYMIDAALSNSSIRESLIWSYGSIAVPMAAAEIIAVILFIMTAIKQKSDEEKEKAKEKKKQRLQDKIDKLN